MQRRPIYYTLLLLAIIPSTFLVFACFLGIIFLLSSFKTDNIPLLLSMIGGICGYFGLLTLLFTSKHPKYHLASFTLLFLGTISMATFPFMDNGKYVLNWFLKIKDPLEWVLYVYPFIILTYHTVKQGILCYKKSNT